MVRVREILRLAAPSHVKDLAFPVGATRGKEQHGVFVCVCV